MSGSSSTATRRVRLQFKEDNLDGELGRRRCSNMGFDDVSDAKTMEEFGDLDCMSELSTQASDSCRPSFSFSERPSSSRSTGRCTENYGDILTYKRIPHKRTNNGSQRGTERRTLERMSFTHKEDGPVVASVASLLKYKQSNRSANCSSDDEVDGMLTEFPPSLPLTRERVQQLTVASPLRLRPTRKVIELNMVAPETEQPEASECDGESTNADSLEEIDYSTTDSLPAVPTAPTTIRPVLRRPMGRR